MTDTTSIGYPPPLWPGLRHQAPDIATDLVALWPLVQHDSDLRWRVEHLGNLIDNLIGDCTCHEGHCWDRGIDPIPVEAICPVFRPSGWVHVSPGRWEQHAEPFEAVITINGTGEFWHWTLWHRPPSRDLTRLDHGVAHTLTDAQHQIDRRSQNHRNWGVTDEGERP